jgi:hypothetical protein
MIREKRIGKDLDGSGSGLIEVLYRHLPDGTEKDMKNPQ